MNRLQRFYQISASELERQIDRCLLWSPLAHLGDGDPATSDFEIGST
jgi:hypothetical protein